MSFQAYIDKVEDKTGESPKQFIAHGEEEGALRHSYVRLGPDGDLCRLTGRRPFDFDGSSIENIGIKVRKPRSSH
jgi:hypothetical protein